MPLIINEQEVKKESLYLKYEAENTLILKSNLYKIDFHFLPSKKKSVACLGNDCFFCKKGLKKNSEYNYYVELNGNEGILNIKPSVFFGIQGLSKAMKKDPRQIKWIVLKKGEGLETEYTVSKDENLDKDKYQEIVNNLEANNEKLAQLMTSREKQLEENYNSFKDNVSDEQVQAEETEEIEEDFNIEDFIG